MFAIGRSYQSSLSPWEDNTRFAICSPYRSSLTPRSIKNFFRSGALMRVHWLPDRRTNFLRSGALNRAYWPSNQSKTFAIALIGAHWLPGRPTNMLWSGALIRAHCHPNRPTLNLCLTNKRYKIGSTYQNTFCDRKLLLELTDSLIDQKLLAIRSSCESSLTPWSSKKLVVIGGSYQKLLPPRLIRISLRSGTLIRAQWLKNWSTTLLRSGALIRAHWPFEEQQERLLTLLLTVKVLAIGSSSKSAFNPWFTKRILAISSSYQSWLTSWSTNNLVLIGSSSQNSFTPWSTDNPTISLTAWSTDKLLAIRSS